MRKAKLISSGLLNVADIMTTGRLRPVSEAAVEAIISSIEALGVMKDEILVRKLRGKKGQLVLIAGGHRLAAAKKLGWEEIPAKVYDCSDDWAKLMEVDDNLAQAELSPLELATFMAERKRVYLDAFPESAHGGDRGNQHSGGRQNETISFCQMIAEKRGVSRRSVEMYVSIGEKLTPYTVASLRATPMKFKDLRELARLEGEEQETTAVHVAFHGAKNVKEALQAARGEPSPTKPEPVDAAFAKIMDAFDRAPKAAQRRFLAQAWAEHPELMAEEAEQAASA